MIRDRRRQMKMKKDGQDSLSVAAQVLEAGGRPLLLGIARDDRKITRDMLTKGLQADDIDASLLDRNFEMQG